MASPFIEGSSARGHLSGGCWGEFATLRDRWRTRFPDLTPCPPISGVACGGRVRHFATPTAVHTCPLLAARPEITPQCEARSGRGLFAWTGPELEYARRQYRPMD